MTLAGASKWVASEYNVKIYLALRFHAVLPEGVFNFRMLDKDVRVGIIFHAASLNPDIGDEEEPVIGAYFRE